MKVEKIMNIDFKKINENKTVFDAVKIMVDEHVWGLVVVNDDGRDTGLMSERSIIKRFILRNKKPDEVLVKQVMRKPIPSVRRDMDVMDVAGYLADNGLERCAVMDQDGKVAGIVTVTDISRYLSKESLSRILLSHRTKDYGHICPKCNAGYLEPVYNSKGEITVYRCTNPACDYEE
ncbi:MAG: CBS domain-containing protein [Thermoplasmata archaeon]